MNLLCCTAGAYAPCLERQSWRKGSSGWNATLERCAFSGCRHLSPRDARATLPCATVTSLSQIAIQLSAARMSSKAPPPGNKARNQVHCVAAVERYKLNTYVVSSVGESRPYILFGILSYASTPATEDNTQHPKWPSPPQFPTSSSPSMS